MLVAINYLASPKKIKFGNFFILASHFDFKNQNSVENKLYGLVTEGTKVC